MTDALPESIRRAAATLALFDAVLASDLAATTKAIDDGADPNGTEVDRPLVAAVLMGNEAMSRLLLSRGADPERETRDGSRALFPAIETTRFDLVSTMLEFGANPTKTNKSGQTPLHIAAEGCHEDVLRLLIDRGCALEAQDLQGRTAMYVAASSGNGRALRFFLREGADADSKPQGFPSAQRKAEEAGDHGCIFLLIAYGAELNEDLEGDFTMITPLEAAVACDDVERFAEILEHTESLPEDQLEQIRGVCESVDGPPKGAGPMSAMLNAWMASRTMQRIVTSAGRAIAPGA